MDDASLTATPLPPEPSTAEPEPAQADELPRTMTIAEAAHACGVTERAMRARVDRGSVRATMGRDHKRKIPVSELYRAGLLDPTRGTSGSDARQLPHSVAAEAPLDVNRLIEQLLDARENLAQHRLLAEHAGSAAAAERAARERAEAELFETRSNVARLEGQLAAYQEQAQRPRKRWFGTSRKERQGA